MCVDKLILPKRNLVSNQKHWSVPSGEPLLVATWSSILWTSLCCFTIIQWSHNIINLKKPLLCSNLCSVLFSKKKKIRRNITNKHGQRQWKQHIIQDHSSLIDTFIDWKSWKTHLRHFNFSKFLGRHATCPPKLDEAFSFIFVYLVSQATHKILAKSPSYTC